MIWLELCQLNVAQQQEVKMYLRSLVIKKQKECDQIKQDHCISIIQHFYLFTWVATHGWLSLPYLGKAQRMSKFLIYVQIERGKRRECKKD